MMKSILYIATVAIIILLKTANGEITQTFTCLTRPGENNSIYLEPNWNFIWTRHRCRYDTVFSTYYCQCIPTLLMQNTSLNTLNKNCVFRGSKLHTRRVDPKPIFFQERIRLTKWIKKSCPSGLFYNQSSCGCTAQSPNPTDQTCQYSGSTVITRKTDVDKRYYQQLYGNVWQREKCFGGTIFSLTKCLCVIGSQPSGITTPKPENYGKTCQDPTSGFYRKTHSSPQCYFQKNKVSHVWDKQSCQAGRIFDINICGCVIHGNPETEPESEHGKGEPETESEGEPESESGKLAQCYHVTHKVVKKGSHNSQLYYQWMPAGNWQLKSCENGRRFNVKSCQCDPLNIITPEVEPEVEPEGESEGEPEGESEAMEKICPKAGILRKVHGNKRYYYEYKSGQWQQKVCENGYIFCYQNCCCIPEHGHTSEPEVEPETETEPEVKPETETEPEVKPETETEPEVEPENLNQCHYPLLNVVRKSSHNPQLYYQWVSSGTWQLKSCENGKTFKIKSCQCDPLNIIKPEVEPEVEPETESERKPETESEGEPETESEGKPETESEGKPETESEGKPETESEGKPETESEGEPESESGKLAQCYHVTHKVVKKGSHNSQLYYQWMPAGNWQLKTCENGRRFNVKSCQCDPLNIITPEVEPEVEPEGESEGEPEGESEGEPEGESEAMEKICPKAGILRKVHGNKRYYYEYKSGQWQQKVCENGYIFCYQNCCCIPEHGHTSEPEVEPETETEPEVEPGNLNQCHYPLLNVVRKSSHNPQLYYQWVSSGTWQLKSCENGKTFKIKSCQCDPLNIIKPEVEPEVEPETESERKPETESEGEPETESEGKPETESEGKPETESEGEPETESEGKPETESEGEPESESGKLAQCYHVTHKVVKKGSHNSQLYYQWMPAGNWQLKTCENGRRFNVKSCQCDPLNIITPEVEPEVEPEGGSEGEPEGESEGEPEGESEAMEKICPKAGILRKVHGNKRYYYEYKSGQWQQKVCENGYIFCYQNCCCIPEHGHTSEPEVEPETETEPEVKPETETEPEVKPETETEPEVKPKDHSEECIHVTDMAVRKASYSSRLYYEWALTRTWQVKSCGNGKRFNIKSCDCVSINIIKPEVKPEVEPETESEGKPETESEGEPETESEGEPETESEGEPETESEGEPESESGKLAQCYHVTHKVVKKGSHNSQLYYQWMPAGNWQLKTCENGRKFNVKSCQCDPLNIITPEVEPEVEPEGESEGEPEGESEAMEKICPKAGILRKVHGNKRYYYEYKSGQWQQKVCENGYIFCYQNCCCIPEHGHTSEPEVEPETETEPEVEPETETEPEVEPENLNQCHYPLLNVVRKSSHNPQLYYQWVSSGTWQLKSCENGKTFKIKSCQCDPLNIIKPEVEPETEPETEPEGKENENLCQHKPSGFIRKPISNPKFYLQMKRSGGFERISCPTGKRFYFSKCCCDSVNQIQTGPTVEDKLCRHKSGIIRKCTMDKNYYFEWIGGSKFNQMFCLNGGIFQCKTCSCVSKTTPAPEGETEPESEGESEPESNAEVLETLCSYKTGESTKMRKSVANKPYFFEMTLSRVWKKYFCPAATKFNRTTCSCNNSGKTLPQPVVEKKETQRMCYYRSFQIRKPDLNKAFYHRYVGRTQWEKVSCPSDSIFSIQLCNCVYKITTG